MLAKTTGSTPFSRGSFCSIVNVRSNVFALDLRTAVLSTCGSEDRTVAIVRHAEGAPSSDLDELLTNLLLTNIVTPCRDGSQAASYVLDVDVVWRLIRIREHHV